MVKMDEDEREIIKSYEKGEWQSVGLPKTKLRQYKIYAKATIKKDRRVNIRISSRDLEGLQKIAMEEGLPYQTLISSILHMYISRRVQFLYAKTYKNEGGMAL